MESNLKKYYKDARLEGEIYKLTHRIQFFAHLSYIGQQLILSFTNFSRRHTLH